MTRTRIAVLAAVVGLLATLLATTTIATSTAEPPGRATQQTTAGGSRGPDIDWGRCPGQGLGPARCGTLPVPADRTEPGGRTVDLSLAVRPADDRKRRIGALLLNNVSGGSAIEQLRLALQSGVLERSVLTSRFDLVAVDPRGVGHSEPVDCGRPQRSRGVTYFPDDRAEFRRLVADDRALLEACRDDARGVLSKMDLATSARDLNAVRRALGERRISLYGIEHTALVARTYARFFPDRVRALALDTVRDDTAPARRQLLREVETVETALHRFAVWCEDSRDCALHGRDDVIAFFDRLVAEADRSPIPVATGPAWTGEDVQRSAQEGLVHRIAWVRYAQALRQAARGDATALQVGQDFTLVQLQDHLVQCDTRTVVATSWTDVRRLQERVQEIAPHTGGATRAWDTVAGCLGWPDRPQRPAFDRPVEGVPPALVMQSTHQSLASYDDAPGLADLLPGSRVLTRRGDDYSMVLFSPCVAKAFDAYLIDRTLPARGAVCRT